MILEWVWEVRKKSQNYWAGQIWWKPEVQMITLLPSICRREKIDDSYLHRQKTIDKIIEYYKLRSKKGSGSLILGFLLRFKLCGTIKYI